jgi:hypothetical protein
MKAEEDIIMPFGKHKGKPLSKVPQGYLLWLYDRKKLTGIIKKYAEDNIPILIFVTNKKSDYNK